MLSVFFIGAYVSVLFIRPRVNMKNEVKCIVSSKQIRQGFVNGFSKHTASIFQRQVYTSPLGHGSVLVLTSHEQLRRREVKGPKLHKMMTEARGAIAEEGKPV